MKSRKLFAAVLGSLIVLALSLPSMAQSTMQSNTTIEGCLDGAIGSYTLTDRAGASYRLTGNTALLKIHVGETVRVTAGLHPLSMYPAP